MGVRSLFVVAMVCLTIASWGYAATVKTASDSKGPESSKASNGSAASTAIVDTQATSAVGAPVADPVPFPVSAKSTAYAESIGGTNHEGETLYFVVGASVQTEQEAQAALDKAIPLFGDMQSYFIVQRSDSFDGMRPGWWVVIEAYRKPPSQENVDFARRAFPDAYVKRSVVGVSAPIPVYEDLVDGL
jgi:hypothetical protein